MHEIQEDLRGFKEMSDADLVSTVLTGWEIVCEENELHRHMVDTKDYEQWAEFRDKTSDKLFEEISAYGNELTKESRQFFEYMSSQMVRATHKNKEQLEAAAAERAVEEASVAQTKVMPVEQKASWLKRITKWLKPSKED